MLPLEMHNSSTNSSLFFFTTKGTKGHKGHIERGLGIVLSDRALLAQLGQVEVQAEVTRRISSTLSSTSTSLWSKSGSLIAYRSSTSPPRAGPVNRCFVLCGCAGRPPAKYSTH